MRAFSLVASLSAWLSAGAAIGSPVDIVYAPSGPLFERHAALLDRAEAFWESRLIGYRDGIEIDRVTLEVGETPFAAPASDAGLVAEAGVRTMSNGAGRVLPSQGFVRFDSANVALLEETGLLYSVLLHETAHALGFGTLWAMNGLSVPGSGAYTGAAALAAYRRESGILDATFVPVEGHGDPRTSDLHWSEDWAGLPDDLMFGRMEQDGAAADITLSRTTLAAFQDLGYRIAPIPVPGAVWAALLGLAALRVARGRRPAG